MKNIPEIFLQRRIFLCISSQEFNFFFFFFPLFKFIKIIYFLNNIVACRLFYSVQFRKKEYRIIVSGPRITLCRPSPKIFLLQLLEYLGAREWFGRNSCHYATVLQPTVTLKYILFVVWLKVSLQHNKNTMWIWFCSMIL